MITIKLEDCNNVEKKLIRKLPSVYIVRDARIQLIDMKFLIMGIVDLQVISPIFNKIENDND